MLQAYSASYALINQVIGSVVAAAVGSGITVISFREKLMRMHDRVDRLEVDHKAAVLAGAQALLDVRRDFEKLCGQLSDRATDARVADRELFERLFQETQRELKQSERRQRYVMDVLTALAQKSGIHHRLTDVLMNTNE